MTSAPFDEHRDVVHPEWIDDNGHLNMGYYVVAFDLATDTWLDHIGLTASERTRSGVTTFTLESHVNYLREVRGEAPLRFTTRLLGFDAKRIHYFHEMYHDGRVPGGHQRAHVSSREPGDTTRGADGGRRA